MRLFKLFKRLFSKLSSDKNSISSKISVKTEKYQGLNPDKIELLIKSYNCKDQEELVIALNEKEINFVEFTEDEKIFYENPEWDYIKSFVELSITLNQEHLFGRSLAIRELTENRYQILSDEFGNPFKELINYTLKYFDSYFIENPIEADELLKANFPIMNQYIKRQIHVQQNNIDYENIFNEQNAYDEFLIFCKNIFFSHYPDKDIRDEKIKYHFKIFHNDLIQFIDDK